ncbi:MAG TPA: thioredoxin-disulfide reductase [Chloroflexi bacterium]|nr:thioredoxin-disulfide reductase [Chloroflexota bacterium]
MVIGAGPSGLTAALYMTREGIEVLVIEKSSVGGQIGTTQILENYPGYDEGIDGAELADRLGNQARKFGAEILEAQEVRSITKQGIYWVVETSDGASYTSKVVLFSTGARYRRLNIPGEEQLMGINVHFCATCDGAFYKGKKVLVIGGGNSGFEEGLFLTRFADQVDIVEFLPEVKASQILQESAERNDQVKVYVNHAVKEFVGEHALDKVLVEDRATGEIKEWQYDGVFVFIGLTPNSDLIKDLAEIDEFGFVLTDKTLMTSRQGLFASGDVRADSTKQAAAAAGEGVTAALMIRQYLKEVG